MLCLRFVLSLSTLIFKAFALKDDFWETAFWMFAGEALFGAFFLCIGRYRRQFDELCRSNGGALIAINASNELINLGGGLANRYALIWRHSRSFRRSVRPRRCSCFSSACRRLCCSPKSAARTSPRASSCRRASPPS